MKEEDCYLTDNREALPQEWQIFVYNTRRHNATYGYCTDSAPKTPTRTEGKTSALWKTHVQARSETTVQGGDHFLVAVDEVAYTHRGLWSSPIPGDPWDKSSFYGYRVRKAGSRGAIVSLVPLNKLR